MNNGEWRMENGEWKMENGEWKMENEKWKMENGEWRMEGLIPMGYCVFLDSFNEIDIFAIKSR